MKLIGKSRRTHKCTAVFVLNVKIEQTLRREIYPEELSYFYQKTGEAIWHLQVVEDFLVKLYMIKAVLVSPGSKTEDQVEVEIAKLEKKTLGQLIGALEKEESVPSDFIERLKEFNAIRKWVVHNSGRESGESLYTDHGRRHFLSRICDFTELAVGFQKEIQSTILEYGKSQNIATEKVLEEAKKTIEKLKANL